MNLFSKHISMHQPLIKEQPIWEEPQGNGMLVSAQSAQTQNSGGVLSILAKHPQSKIS